MGTQLPLPKKGTEPPICSPCLLWPNGCLDQDAISYGGRPRPRPHCAKWGPSSRSPKGVQPGNFKPMFVVTKRLDEWMDQDATWYDYDGTGNIVLDADPAPPPRGTAPNFGPCLLWPYGRMDQDATSYEGRPRLRPHCVTWGPSSPSQKGHNSPQFSDHVYCGQTVAHLSCC